MDQRHRLGAILRRNAVEAGERRVHVTFGKKCERVWDDQRVLQASVDEDATDVLTGAGLGVGDSLHGGELHRLPVRHLTSGDVADDDLRGRQGCRDGEREEQPDPMVAVVPSAEHSDRVHGCHGKTCDHERGEDHVCGLHRCRRVQDGHEWMHIGDSSAGEDESLRIVHPRIRRHHEEGRCDTRDRDGHAAREMHPR